MTSVYHNQGYYMKLEIWGYMWQQKHGGMDTRREQEIEPHMSVYESQPLHLEARCQPKKIKELKMLNQISSRQTVVHLAKQEAFQSSFLLTISPPYPTFQYTW